MRNIRSIPGCLILLTFCLIDTAGQKSVPYPQDATGVIDLVTEFSQSDFSVSEAIKRLGTVYSAKPDDFRIALTPFPSRKKMVEAVELVTSGEASPASRKLDYVEIKYIRPISISYGELREKYGAPEYMRPPVVKCGPRSVNCPPRFVGYRFSFVPDPTSLASGKNLAVGITLEMEWSKEVPHHTDKDFLAVKTIRIKRIWRG